RVGEVDAGDADAVVGGRGRDRGDGGAVAVRVVRRIGAEGRPAGAEAQVARRGRDAGVEYGDRRRAERIARAVDLIPADHRQVPLVRVTRVGGGRVGLAAAVALDVGDVRVRLERSDDGRLGVGRDVDGVHRERRDCADIGGA